MYTRIKTYLLGFLLTLPLLGWAQQPVQVNVQMIPPYSVTLSDYAIANSDRLIVTLLLGDVSEFNRQVELRLAIKGNGLAVQSAPIVANVTTVSLDGGVPRRLTNIDLRPYFEFDNLVGVSPLQYSRPLPAGLYQFCFEVYDFLTGRLISTQSCATAYIILNDPPILNLPVRNENVPFRDPQNIVFNWTPRHVNATNIQYEFTLAEIWDTNIDPQAAFLASRPLYQTTTRATTLLYGPAETPLLPDKTYAWRVRAIALDGISELSLFKNGGYSEIYHFNYTQLCNEPQYVLVEPDGYNKVQMFWQGQDHIKYQVQYRKKDGNNSGWFEVNAYNENAKIQRLEENTTYEYRVGGQCGYNEGYTFSRIFEFTTGIRGEDKDFNCGVTPEPNISNQDPLPQIGVNEVFTAGEFPVTVKQVDGNDGIFSGWGYIVVPYLGDTRIKISFDRIRINTDYLLTEGILVTDYDPEWGGVVNVNEELASLESLFNEISNILSNYTGTEEQRIQLEEAQTQASEQVNALIPDQENLNASQQVIQQALEEFNKNTDNLLAEKENPSENNKKETNESNDKLSEAIKEYAEGINAENSDNTAITQDEYFDGVLPFTESPAAIGPIDSSNGESIDLAPLFSKDYAKRKDSLSAQIGTNKTLFLTNSYASTEKIASIKKVIENPASDKYYIWKHYDLENKELKYKIAFGATFFGSLAINQPEYVDVFNDILTFNIREFIGVEVVSMSRTMDLLLNSYKDNPLLTKELIQGYSTYDLLKLYIVILKQCASDFSKQTEGIVPKCLWNQNFNPAVAYYAGFIDGAWETLEGVVGIGKFAGAWSLQNPIFYTEEGARIRQETILMMTMIGELYSSEEKRSEAAKQISTLFDGYVDDISSLDSQGRYLQGKLIFDIAGFFIGVSEINAFIKTGKITSATLKGLQKLAKGGKKLVLAIGKKIEVDKNKIVTYILNANLRYNIARFGDDGILIAETWIDKPAKVLDKIGDIAYRTSSNAAEQTAELGVVRGRNGEVGLGLLNKVADVVFRIGDNIAGFTVKQVRAGSNGKVAVIGRSMGNSKNKGIRDIYNDLLQKGNKAEIFDASSLKGKWLNRFNDAMEQFAERTDNWTKRLSNQELLKLDMYKLNKEWVDMLKKEGYTIIDMGDFNNQGFSAFYAMEKNIIFR